MKTKDFLLKGTVVGLRETDDHRVLSYDIQTDLGYEMACYRRFLRPLHKDEETTKECTNVTEISPDILHKSADSSVDITTTDVPRRSARKQQNAREKSI